MEFSTIRFEKSEQVATIVMRRPDELNAFNVPMLKELLKAFEDAGVDEDIRCVIFTGEGRAFCAGADVKGADDLLSQIKEGPEEEDILRMLTRVVMAIRRTPKPVIGAVNGVAAGAGANLALACDITIASEKARFAEVFLNIGLVPDGGGTFFVPETIGYHRAAELFFTGRILTAEEAFSLGLYNRVVPAEEVMQAAQELAQNLAARPPVAIAETKALLNREILPRLRAHIDEENRSQRKMFATADAREGFTAFAEKRKPNFVGR